MTSPSGSIGIGVTIDAGDLDTQITRAVQAAMGDVLSEVRRGLGNIESLFGGIDLADFQRNVTRQTRTAGQNLEQGMERSAQRAGGAVADAFADGARAAAQSLSRIDSSALTRITRGAADAGAEIQRLNRWQLNDLIESANRAGQMLGTEIAAGASHAERALRGMDADALEGLIRDARRAQQELDNVGNEAEQAGNETESAFGGATDRMKEMAGAAAGAAAAMVGIAGIADTIGEAIERSSIGNKLQAQLDLTEQDSASAGKIAGDVFAANYGESFEQVSDAVGAVLSNNLANFADDGAAAVQSVTQAALTLADTFGVDVADSTQVVQQLIRNGLVPDATTGFDQLGAAFQRVPAAMRDELPDLINEYGTFFSSLGFNGQEAFGALVNASFEGQIAMDKVGDALKEVGIRATDIGDKGAVEALDAIGLAGENIQTRLLAGGDTAKVAFQQMIDGLLAVQDPGEQAAAAVALIGTPLEDLNKAEIPAFLQAMGGAGEAMNGFEGSVGRMGDALAQGPGAALETFKRGVQQNLIETLGNTVSFFQENEKLAYSLATALGVLLTAYLALRAAAVVGAVITGVAAAMSGAGLAAGASAVATGAYTVALGVLRVASIASTVATVAMTAATWAFNAALAVLTSPITAIVVAIGLVIAALVLFFTKTEVGKAVFQTLKDAVVTAWNAILAAIQAVWGFLQPIFAAIWSFIVDTLVPAFKAFAADVVEAWNAWSGVVMAIWNNVVMPVFNFIVSFIRDTLWPAFQAFAADVVEAWNSWSSLISAIWTNVVQPVFNALVGFVMNQIVPAIQFFWNIVQTAFDAIGAIISFWWNNVVNPIFDAYRFVIMEVIVPAIMFLWQNVVQPAFDTIGSIISGVWTGVISPTFDAIKTGLSAVGDFFSTIVTGIGNVWDGLRGLLAKPINFMIGTVYNNGIRKAWNTIEKFIPGIDAAPELPLIPEHYTGGRIRGPKGRDNVLMWGSDDEHMLTVSDVAKAGGHNIIYAIRDMIQRGVPFSWDNGQLVQELGRSNLESYGAAVQSKGYGNVDPQGLFDQLKPPGVRLPKFYRGGPVDEDQPWMQQLLKGHEFARAQHGKPYQWAGPTGPGSSFDCSGFMGSIAAAILGQNPWQRYWATSSFAGYPATGPQGFVKGLKDGGFVIGVTDDPGGPGGGHTAGVLGAVKALSAARVESGGALGDVHYGTGTDPLSFASVYGLPIGANGFFDPGSGIGGGPSPEDQRSFLERKVSEAFDTVLNPIKDGIATAIGAPPPEWLAVPGKFLDHAKETVIKGAFGLIGGLGDRLGEAWGKAQDVGSAILDAVNPFDDGGIANGTGFVPKNVIAPERVLSPEQTKLFEALVAALQAMASGGGQAAGSIVDAIGSAVGTAMNDVIKALVPEPTKAAEKIDPDTQAFMEKQQAQIDAQGEVISNVESLAKRTESSQAAVLAAQMAEVERQLVDIANQLTGGVLGPVVQSAMQSALGVVKDALAASTEETVAAQEKTTAAVKNIDTGDDSDAAPFGAPGSAFDFASAISDAVVSVSNTASQALLQVGQDIAKAALAQQKSIVDESRGTLGDEKNSGGLLVDTIVRLTGVEIQIRDTIAGLGETIREFRGDEFQKFDENGQIISDTASLIERTASSQELVIAEQNRINRELIKSVLRYLMVNVVLPILVAIMTALITVATTAIGAAIGTAIGGPVGTAIGAAIGAVVGVALSAAAGAALAGIGLGAAAAIDSFDSGGVATGVGLMPKNTIAPERVLSPRQTSSFDRLVDILDGAGLTGDGTKSVNIGNMNIQGPNAAKETADNLLSLLNN